MKSVTYAKKFLNSYLQEISPKEIVLPDEDMILKELYKSSFYHFTKYMWSALNIDRYKDNWHIKVVCEHLEAMYHRQIKKMVINIPPRMGKSILVSVLFPIWCWINNPRERFFYSSYADTLNKRDALAFRSVLESKLFRKYWGHEIFLPRGGATLNYLRNNMGGTRYCATPASAVTGMGFDRIVIDDPNSVTTSESLIFRTKVNSWFDYTLPTRVHDPEKTTFLIVQQRTHCFDLSGHVLSKPNSEYIHLFLPMEFEKSRRCVTVPLKSCIDKPWSDPRQKEGELLFEEHYSFQSVKSLKESFNNDSYRISGQLQQRPSPLGGGVIKTSWFNIWKERDLPKFETILQSWDTALTKGINSSYSAATTWGLFQINNVYQLMLLSVFKDKLEYPDLRKMVLRMANNYHDTDFENPLFYKKSINTLLIEAKGSGYTLLADLRSLQWPKTVSLIGFDPTIDAELNSRKGYSKEGRARLVTHLIESGQVWLQADKRDPDRLTEDSQIFLNACELFPSSDSNDIIDTWSQAFITFAKSGMIYNKGDNLPEYVDPAEELLKKTSVKYW